MGYHRNDDIGCLLFLLLGGGVYIILGGGAYIISQFGWTGLFFAFATAAILLSLYVMIPVFMEKRSIAIRGRLPCKHGVPGGLAAPDKCAACQAEADAARAATLKKQEEEKIAAEAARHEAYLEWLARIRLPEYLKEMHPREFENLVCLLFRQMGYRVEATPYVGDSGVDGYLYKDGQKVVLQCKRVKGSVGEPVLRDLYGAMYATGSNSALVVTTGSVSPQARAWAQGKPIKLVELEELLSLIKNHFHEEHIIPADYFPPLLPGSKCPSCGATLRKVKGHHGPFWGCTRYPQCRFAKAIGRRSHR